MILDREKHLVILNQEDSKDTKSGCDLKLVIVDDNGDKCVKYSTKWGDKILRIEEEHEYLNCAVNKYLRLAGYHLTAMTFNEEPLPTKLYRLLVPIRRMSKGSADMKESENGRVRMIVINILLFNRRYARDTKLTNKRRLKYSDGSFHLAIALGYSWPHPLKSRMILHWNGNENYASIEKSPFLRSTSAPYSLTCRGIRNSLSNNKKNKKIFDFIVY